MEPQEHKQLLPNPPTIVFAERKPEDYVFGGVTKLVGEPLVSPARYWLDSLPSYGEHQAFFTETFNCTGFGYIHRIIILIKRVFGVEKNYSERALGIASGTKPPGNSLHTVAETGRTVGLCDESVLPFDSSIVTVEKYYQPKPLPQTILDLCHKFLEWIVPMHDWVNTDSKDNILNALAFSPLGLTVCAWFRRPNGTYYFPPFMQNNHDSTLAFAKPNEFWVFWDSYPEDREDVMQSHIQEFGVTHEQARWLKKVEWDVNFQQSKRYWLGPAYAVLISGWQRLLDLAKQVLSALFAEKKIIETPKVITPIDEHLPPPAEPVEHPRVINLQRFTEAIKEFEGWYPGSRSYRNKNPGNLKYTSLTKELGAISADETNHCIFRTDDEGFFALQKFVKLASEDKLRDYHNCSTKSFFKVYAEANFAPYAKIVSSKVGVDENKPLKEFI